MQEEGKEREREPTYDPIKNLKKSRERKKKKKVTLILNSFTFRRSSWVVAPGPNMARQERSTCLDIKRGPTLAQESLLNFHLLPSRTGIDRPSPSRKGPTACPILLTRSLKVPLLLLLLLFASDFRKGGKALRSKDEEEQMLPYLFSHQISERLKGFLYYVTYGRDERRKGLHLLLYPHNKDGWETVTESQGSTSRG